ncbi:peroxidasin-like [Haliotis cracherodii]|uniref:peroxidasin-like n=1 Tax=Haliotis cracherodii TaxID=6455 RepID=UPI0039EC630F
MFLVTLFVAGIAGAAGSQWTIDKNIPEVSDGIKIFNEGSKFDLILAQQRANLSERIAKKCVNNLKYRPLDGVCNNIKNPNWGAPLQGMRRLLDAKYDDDKGSPRLFGGNKEPLPSAREVSVECFTPDSRATEDKKFTRMMMQWGQFLDHDITGTPKTDAKSCCPGMATNGVHNDYQSDGPCFPIPIPTGDRQFMNCMEFSRSQPVRTTSERCRREQLNALTAYIDGSNVYGGSEKEAAELRTSSGGRLASTKGGTRLPHTNQTTCLKRTGHSCFNAGDVRVNEFPGLTSMHTMWMREHNRLAAGLARRNRKWNDETLFQEARKIVIASMQHITYHTWLRNVLGDKVYRLFDLSGTYRYNASVNPGIFNSFAAAAFRFGHSQIAGHYRVKGNANLEISEMFFDTSFVTNGYDEILSGLTVDNAQGTDKAFTNGIIDHLFENTFGPGASLDLVALNIQRGRDHGLPPYMDFINHISKIPGVRSLLRDDLTVPKCAVGLYKCLNDVDLFVGGMREQPLGDALLGPTFAYILATQFQNLRLGDRFWYEGADTFTAAQLAEIRKVTLSRVICDNSKISRIQRDAFKLITRRNRKIRCRHLSSLNLGKWKA